MKILIANFPRDVHGIAVRLNLEDQGHEVVTWFSGNFPRTQGLTLEVSNYDMSWSIRDQEQIIRNSQFDAVWWRRPMKPVLDENLHAGDAIVAERESFHLFESFSPLLSDSAFLLNCPKAKLQAKHKPTQLIKAKALGFRIPRTIFSNDPESIRDFCSSLKGEVIFKTFHPAAWKGETLDGHVTLARKFDFGSIPEKDVLRLSPGIFQEYIEKDYEVRVTCFGTHAEAVKIKSQEGSAIGKVDWRGDSRALKLERIELPTYVQDFCKNFMKSFGLNFGCFDFIVTHDGEYVFLEINEMGQFLWIENIVSELKLLDMFCQYITSKTFDFAPNQDNDREFSGNSFASENFRNRIIKEKAQEIAIYSAMKPYHIVQE